MKTYTEKNASTFRMNGISQVDRFPETLNPGYFKTEGRTMDELLLFVIGLSRHIRYFNPQDKPEGSWEDLFLMDPHVLTRYLSTFYLENSIHRYDRSAYKLDQLLCTRETPALEDLEGPFKELEELFKEFDDSVNDLDRYIHQVSLSVQFRNHSGFRDVIERYQKSREEIKGSERLQGLLPMFEQLKRNIKSNASREVLTGEMESIRHRFSNLILTNDLLTATCKDFVNNHEKDGYYEPHTGLLLSFLGNYKLLADELNKLTGKHLDYYFNKELGIEPKPQLGDSVYLSYRLNPEVQEFYLTRKDKVFVEPKGGEPKIVFSPNEDFMITNTRVRELKTFYKSESAGFGGESKGRNGVGKIYRVYCADNPVYEPADFLDKERQFNTWPVLGEDQSVLLAGKRTMNDAELGLMVCSPLLFANAGTRKYQLKFYLTEQSYRMFEKYAEDFKEAENEAHSAKAIDIFKRRKKGNNESEIPSDLQIQQKSREVILFEMLNNAFRIKITGTEGWIRVKNYWVSLGDHSEERKESISRKITIDPDQVHFLLLEFELGPSEGAVGCYNQALHGPENIGAFPQVSIKLNNHVYYHPFSFLQYLRISRLTINLKVEGNANLHLRNNFGPLSLASPFQLFGPQPDLNCYLDIRNTNMFNRYTRNFLVKLYWFDLPVDIDGFDAYYAAYLPEIRNDSFKVAINPLVNGMSANVDKERLQLNLFHIKDRYLDDQTILTHRSFSALQFNNSMQMEKEQQAGLNNFNEGALRIELLKPAGGFGHKLYPVLFPAALMHNSGGILGGIFRKKIPIPNPPVAPKIQHISVNYELEYSVLLSGQNRIRENEEPVEIGHYYPYGYKTVFPGRTTGGIPFIPDFQDHKPADRKEGSENKANLYIGLSDLVPGRELNLLFQLNEHNYLEPENKDEKLRWYYLADNEWTEIDATDILTDDTCKFIYSGIIKLRVPIGISKGNTLLTPDLYWLRVSSNGFIRTRVRTVIAQAVSATRVFDDTDFQLSFVQLEPGSIRELSRKAPQLAEVIQPFASFGGRRRETEYAYRTRVSELLGNKQRMISGEDIARTILEHFPDEISKVICYQASAPQYNYRPGLPLQVVLLPQLRNSDAGKIRKPKVKISTIYKVRDHLIGNYSTVLDPDALEVRNPDYEMLKVVCSVVFREDRQVDHSGKYVQMLNNDLHNLISPWISGDDMDIITEGYIYPSEVLNFIKKRPYVRFVTSFSMFHFYSCYHKSEVMPEARVIDSTTRGVSFLKTFLPGAVFISVEQHDITSINASIPEQSPSAGITHLAIGSEFLVNEIRGSESYISGEQVASDETEWNIRLI